jgi:hypothetical protein
MLFKFLSFASAPRTPFAKRKKSLVKPSIFQEPGGNAFGFPSHSYPAECFTAPLVVLA